MAALVRGPLLLASLLLSLNAQPSHNAPHLNKDGYVGSKACYGCHSAIYQSFKKTDMGQSLTPASAWSTERLPPEASIKQPSTERTFAVFHDAAGWHQRESEADVFAAEYPLEYAVGSGANGITFLIRRGSYLFQAPLSYYAKTKKWDFSPGYEQVDLGFSRSVPQECINCHAGRASPVNDRPGAFEDSPFGELAIGCENCHGAGRAHVQSLGKQAGSIVNPAKLGGRLAENICMNCHQGGDARVLQPGKSFYDFRPGSWLFDTAIIIKKPQEESARRESDLLEHYSAMQASRCFRESSGKLSCLTCHDPHVQPRQADVPRYFRSKCLTCHNEGSCKVPVKIRAQQSPPDDCAGCHMQKRSVLEVSHSALTDHRIPAKQGELIPPAIQQQVDDLVIVNVPRGRPVQLSNVTLLRAYSQLATQDSAYGSRFDHLLDELSKTEPHDSFVQSALGHKALLADKPEEAIAHLQQAFEPANAGINFEMGEAFAKLGRFREALEYTEKAADLDPYNAAIQKTLILEFINAKAYGEARQHLEQYIHTFPEDSFMRGLLAKVNQ